MRRLLPIGVTLAALALVGVAHAGQIWTDGNGDGLPDGGFLIAPPSTNVTVGVWIDAQSFTWTNFLAYVEWSGDCISYVSAQYVIGGMLAFPIDNFSHPRGVGFGGSGGNGSGVTHIGNVTLHVNTLVNCCVTPIIDVYNPYYVFSQLGAGSAYMLFTTNPRTCYGFGPEGGACCFPDGSCDVTVVSACLAGGGVYQGDGVNCAQVICEPQQTEACCFPDCSCVEAPVGQCPPGSAPLGPGTSCSPNPCACPPQLEACCFPEGSCIDALVGQCPAGSVPQGPGTTCANTFCEGLPPTGACCFADFTCIDGVTQEVCSASGGFVWYQGVPCDQSCVPDAVESKSWGQIKGLFR